MLDPKTRNTRVKQLILAFAMVARKLISDLQAYTILVLTRQLLWLVVMKFDVLSRLIRWFIKLSEFHLQYRLRIAIKAQVLANFVVKQMEEQYKYAPNIKTE